MKASTFYNNYYPVLIDKLQKFLTNYSQTLDAQGTPTIQPYIKEYIHATQNFITNPGKYLRPYFAFITYFGIGSNLFQNKKSKQQSSTSKKTKSQPVLVLQSLKPDEVITTTPLIISAYLELIHDHLLIHDDIMDKSIKRRSQPTVWKELHKKLKHRHNSYSLAILSGDQALLMAFKLLSYLKTPTENGLKNIISTTYEYINRVIQGQVADITLQQQSLQNVTKNDVLWIYQNKTATYTTKMPVAMVDAFLNQKLLVNKDFNLALNKLGIALQIIDDFKDLLPGPKTQYTDIQERKYTLLLLNALKNVGNHYKKYLLNMYSTTKPLNSAQKHKIANILIRYGYKPTKQILNKLLEQATGLINGLPISEPNTQLSQFIFKNQLYVIELYANKIIKQLDTIYKTMK